MPFNKITFICYKATFKSYLIYKHLFPLWKFT